MATGWEALKAAWRGQVPGADLAAMFTATAGLSRLHEALEDRRLEAQIAQSPSGQSGDAGQPAQPGRAGADWRVALALGRVAAPLWLADALVALAGAFYDAETQLRPGHAASVSPSIHDLVASLLLPVEDIIADVTAALADPGRRATLTAPLRVGPGGDIADSALPRAPSVAYAQELATGARRIHTAAAAALATLRAAFTSSPPPIWLEAGLRRLDGDLQAAGARLDMAEVRVGALAGTVAGTHGDESVAREAVCRDLWYIVGVAVVAGQLIADPHLMPEAAAAAQSSSSSLSSISSQSLYAPTPPMPPMPPVSAREAEQMQAALPLPEIDAGAAPLMRRQDTATPSHLAPPVDSDSVALPQIEEGGSSSEAPQPLEPSATPQPTRHLPEPLPPASSLPTITLPVIGEAPVPALKEPLSSQSTTPTDQSPQSSQSSAPTGGQEGQNGQNGQNEDPPLPLPEIG